MAKTGRGAFDTPTRAEPSGDSQGIRAASGWWATSCIIVAAIAIAITSASWSETIALAFAAAAVILLWARLRAYVSAVGVLSLAARHLDAGNPENAAKLLETAALGRGAIDAQINSYLAVAYLRAAEVDKAIAVCAELQRSESSRLFWVGVSAKHTCGYCHAAAGDLDEAERIYLLLPRGRTSLPLHYLLMCKQQRFAKVAARSRVRRLRAQSGRSLRASNHLGEHGERVVALLSAFALSRVEESANSRHVDELLAAAQPAVTDEYSYLESNWPELRQFLIEHPLSARASAAPPVSLAAARVESTADIPTARCRS